MLRDVSLIISATPTGTHSVSVAIFESALRDAAHTCCALLRLMGLQGSTALILLSWDEQRAAAV